MTEFMMAQAWKSTGLFSPEPGGFYNHFTSFGTQRMHRECKLTLYDMKIQHTARVTNYRKEGRLSPIRETFLSIARNRVIIGQTAK